MKIKTTTSLLVVEYGKKIVVLLACLLATQIHAQPVCHAQFYHYASATNADSVHFYNQSPAGTHYSWTFGDGGTSDSNLPWHFYTHTGTYYVCLTVTDTTSLGTCSMTWCDT